MSFDLTQKVKIVNPHASNDELYGPYNSIELALIGVPLVLREKGRTVAIIENNNVVEYWFKEGIQDVNLVEKTQEISAEQIGLGNVDNTSDLEKPISTATQEALDQKANTADLAQVAFTGDYNDLINIPEGNRRKIEVPLTWIFDGNLTFPFPDGSEYNETWTFSDVTFFSWRGISIRPKESPAFYISPDLSFITLYPDVLTPQLGDTIFLTVKFEVLGQSVEPETPSFTFTTLGGNLTRIPNPSAITFPRFNADNTVSALSAVEFMEAIGIASASSSGVLSSVDWTTFNTKIGGSGTVNYLSKFTALGAIGNSQIFDNGTNVGIGTDAPTAKLDVIGLAKFRNAVATSNASNFPALDISGFNLSALTGTTHALSGLRIAGTMNFNTFQQRLVGLDIDLSSNATTAQFINPFRISLSANAAAQSQLINSSMLSSSGSRLEVARGVIGVTGQLITLSAREIAEFRSMGLFFQDFENTNMWAVGTVNSDYLRFFHNTASSALGAVDPTMWISNNRVMVGRFAAFVPSATLQVRGEGTTAATRTFLAQNSGANDLVTIFDDGQFRLHSIPTLGTSPATVIVPSATGVLSSRTLAQFMTDLITENGGIPMVDGANIRTGTTTGTRIGTTTTQRIGFWNATPIVQPTTSVAAGTLVSNAGTALTSTDTIDGYTIQQVIRALRNTGLLA